MVQTLNYEQKSIEIIDAFVKSCSDYETDSVKTYFTELADEDFKVYSSKQNGEFIYDLCWAIEDDDWNFENSHHLELVLETEKDKNWKEIAQDFYKLLDSKAPIKIGVCQYSPCRLKSIQQMIKTYKFKLPGKEFYIIFLYNSKHNSFAGYLIDHDGETLYSSINRSNSI